MGVDHLLCDANIRLTTIFYDKRIVCMRPACMSDNNMTYCRNKFTNISQYLCLKYIEMFRYYIFGKCLINVIIPSYQVSPHVCTPSQSVSFGQSPGQSSQYSQSQSPMISHSPLTQQSPVTVQDKNAFYFDSRQHDARATTNVNEKNLEALFPPSGNRNNGTLKLHEIKAKRKNNHEIFLHYSFYRVSGSIQR